MYSYTLVTRTRENDRDYNDILDLKRLEIATNLAFSCYFQKKLRLKRIFLHFCVPEIPNVHAWLRKELSARRRHLSDNKHLTISISRTASLHFHVVMEISAFIV